MSFLLKVTKGLYWGSLLLETAMNFSKRKKVCKLSGFYIIADLPPKSHQVKFGRCIARSKVFRDGTEIPRSFESLAKGLQNKGLSFNVPLIHSSQQLGALMS